MTASDIYHEIVQIIVNSIEEDWILSELNIQYVDSVRFNLNYFD